MNAIQRNHPQREGQSSTLAVVAPRIPHDREARQGRSEFVWGSLCAAAGAIVGAAIQLLSSEGSGVSAIPGIILDSQSAWCAIAFLAGCSAKTWPRACVAGQLAQLSALLAFNALQQPFNQLWSSSLSWLPAIVLTGALFGVAGYFAVSRGPWRHLWRMAVPGIVAVESGLTVVLRGADNLTLNTSIVELILACAALVALFAAFCAARWNTSRDGSTRPGPPRGRANAPGS